MSEQLMILVAGPYRGGTNDDPVLIQRNVEAMEDMALKVFRRGHLPVMGEWFALPLLKHAGSEKIGDAVFDEIFHPVARELIGKCDAVLRIGGPSTGAGDMVATGRKLGKTIFRSLDEIPRAYSVRLESAERNMPAATTTPVRAFPGRWNRERFHLPGNRSSRAR
ncbi:MAG: DUF4406 domain-containing protein [Reyranella sp.]|uniref:DUF4406 domain-containing protein n=1 Tax=Reyranella sp. TaxID=1929291 RepID=UPI001AC3E755|nr:DUF4406 domain-containing protein [Reyranella sp.]MBN9088131.1 DUF4406 domain-containing protein [Reyranella sp.]